MAEVPPDAVRFVIEPKGPPQSNALGYLLAGAFGIGLGVFVFSKLSVSKKDGKINLKFPYRSAFHSLRQHSLRA